MLFIIKTVNKKVGNKQELKANWQHIVMIDNIHGNCYGFLKFLTINLIVYY